MYICIHACTHVYLFLYLSFCLSVCLSFYPSVYPSMSVCMYVCMKICKLHLRAYCKTAWFASKELLGNLCVHRPGVHHLQSCSGSFTVFKIIKQIVWNLQESLTLHTIHVWTFFLFWHQRTLPAWTGFLQKTGIRRILSVRTVRCCFSVTAERFRQIWL